MRGLALGSLAVAGASPVRRATADLRLDLVELGQCVRTAPGRDRRVASPFGYLIEAAAEVAPAEGQRQRARRRAWHRSARQE